MAVLEVAEEADAEEHDGDHGHAGVEHAVSLGELLLVHGQHERDALEGVNGRAEVHRPRAPRGDQVEFGEGLHRAHEEQLVHDDEHGADHERVGDGAEGGQRLQALDHAEERQRADHHAHDELDAHAVVGHVEVEHLLHVRRHEYQVHAADAELGDDEKYADEQSGRLGPLGLVCNILFLFLFLLLLSSSPPASLNALLDGQLDDVVVADVVANGHARRLVDVRDVLVAVDLMIN